MEEEKLTKKQRKALEFRKKIEKKEKKPEEPKPTDTETQKKRKLGDEVSAASDEDAPKKKRKTRRGKKGKGVNGGKGPRFLLFVGNLPYDVSETELAKHFKNSKPDRMRIRKDKGIAFLEFDNDTREIQSKMESALRMHHSMVRTRKINVELTVGGGGNSETRVQKIKGKNDKLLEERRDRVKTKGSAAVDGADTEGIHPSRLAMVNK
ncbi:40S ribosomal subunit biogenesis protein [Yamadazyma tenuis]|uniref:RRM domain-containing protein n=1 Tax=Candida tenuis (strain ATCC 10573 / BCRC 21748 / CBS 615 / JCM 9827 / NBRC 10315 / NRRL Y-1498 / VKM Y-70) TaxID=590646 RepID=G3B3V8_CANTC|nr:uncharacterized protein CANTEDRAFT_97802 [Yamadazyma tenuis ATCC 10573]EGV63744.1 hypothetical protein CANTEDRAFT_97802 [Yamadazyma tenuis ATCC 10573]WEJ96646.1 40S ribosomal subunit biogenesis protein [Yamadazyma tenuis]